MKEEVEDVAAAISDVKEMLRDAATLSTIRNGTSHAGDVTALNKRVAQEDQVPKAHVPWQVEWLRQVEKLVKMDAGWGWEHFFQMIEYNIASGTIAAPVRVNLCTALLTLRV